MVPTETEIIGLLQLIMTMKIILTDDLTTRESLVANLANNPIFQQVLPRERNFLEILRWCVAEGFVGMNTLPTGEPGRPAHQYFVSEKGKLKLKILGEEQVPEGPPLTTDQGQNGTCVSHACAKALLEGCPDDMEFDFHSVFMALLQHMDMKVGITKGDYFNGVVLNLPDNQNIVREVPVTVEQVFEIGGEENAKKFVVVVIAGSWLYEEEDMDPDEENSESLHMMQVYRVEEGEVFATNSWGGGVRELKVPKKAVVSLWKVEGGF